MENLQERLKWIKEKPEVQSLYELHIIKLCEDFLKNDESVSDLVEKMNRAVLGCSTAAINI